MEGGMSRAINIFFCILLLFFILLLGDVAKENKIHWSSILQQVFVVFWFLVVSMSGWNPTSGWKVKSWIARRRLRIIFFTSVFLLFFMAIESVIMGIDWEERRKARFSAKINLNSIDYASIYSHE